MSFRQFKRRTRRLRLFESLEHRRVLVATADLDLDGDIDLISNGVAFENIDGAGNFATVRFDDTACGICALGDLDGDGDPDVATSAGWFENQAGAFDRFHAVAVPGEFDADRLRISEVSDEGPLDVLAFDGSRLVQWHVSDGQGVVVLDQEFDGRVVDAADVNRDGWVDVLTVLPNREVALQWQVSAGQFEPSLLTDYASIEFYTYFVDATLADLNGDGWVDMLLQEKYDIEFTSVAVRLNDQGPTPSGAPFIPGGYLDAQCGWDFCRYEVVDMDRDGDLDVLEVRHPSFEAGGSIHENDGTGKFRFLASGRANAGEGVVAAADLNGDGVVDFINPSGVWLDGATDQFHVPDSTPPLPTPGPTVFLTHEFGQMDQRVYEIADLNGDQVPELIETNDESAVRIWSANGNLLTTVLTTGPGDVAAPAGNVAAEDLSGDGLPDLVYVFVGRIYWKENLGDFNFGPARHLLTAESIPTPWAFGDLNGDGTIDAAAIMTEPMTRVVIGMSDGAGGHTTQTIDVTPLGRKALYVEIVDVDGDGDNDIYLLTTVRDLGTNGQGLLEHQWLENSQGEFQPIQVIRAEDVNSYNMQVRVSDVNGDGRQDLVLANGWGVRWYPGFSGDPLTITTEFESSPSDQSQIELADLNDDGRLDLVTTSAERVFAYYALDGQGAFGEAQRVGFATRGYILDVSDWDADGDVDIVTVGDGGLVTQFEQRVTGDVNNDGVFDSSDLVLIFAAGQYEDGI
ncbi:MAG: VCBS repeat-containing protein, partial [Planctomycetales bacterium]|nr:VCBS repeat-containing protein [Planctomycetales bacterium]